MMILMDYFPFLLYFLFEGHKPEYHQSLSLKHSFQIQQLISQRWYWLVAQLTHQSHRTLVVLLKQYHRGP